MGCAPQVTYTANGQYTASYSVNAPGAYTVTVTINGVTVVGTPAVVTFASGQCCNRPPPGVLISTCR